MKLLYISCHEILEYDEVRLFAQLGIDVFSAGAYRSPLSGGSMRPSIPELTYHPDLEHVFLQQMAHAGTGIIPKDLVDWADTIVYMHMPELLAQNWESIKHKRVIFRSIGQMLPHQEDRLRHLKNEGLQIVRFSPYERLLQNYAGEDALIRFYKDPDEYQGYTGEQPVAIAMSQSIKRRGAFCFYDEVAEILDGFPSRIYGSGNDDLGDRWGGLLTYAEQIAVLQQNRVLVYAGTWPAAYTLAFIEAWMTGIPIVSVGRNMALERLERVDYFEVPELLHDGYAGVASDDIFLLRDWVEHFLKDIEFARQVGKSGRGMAIRLFGKETIRAEWQRFLLN